MWGCGDVRMWNESPPLEESETKIRQRISPSGEKEEHQEGRAARSTVGYGIEEVNMNVVNVESCKSAPRVVLAAFVLGGEYTQYIWTSTSRRERGSPGE